MTYVCWSFGVLESNVWNWCMKKDWKKASPWNTSFTQLLINHPSYSHCSGWDGGSVQDPCRVFQHLHLPWPPAPCWRSHSSAQTLKMTSHLPEHRASILTRVWSPQPPGPPLLTAPQPHWPAGSSCTPSALPSRPRLGGLSSWEKLALHLRSHLGTNVTGSRRSLWSTSFKRPILALYPLICLTVFKTLIAVRYTFLYFFFFFYLLQLDFSFMKAAVEAFCS